MENAANDLAIPQIVGKTPDVKRLPNDWRVIPISPEQQRRFWELLRQEMERQKQAAQPKRMPDGVQGPPEPPKGGNPATTPCPVSPFLLQLQARVQARQDRENALFAVQHYHPKPGTVYLGRDLAHNPVYNTGDPLLDTVRLFESQVVGSMEDLTKALAAVVANPEFQRILAVLGAGAELAGGAAMLIVPDPTGLTKVAAVISIGHGADSLVASLASLETGEHVPTLTHRAGAGAMRLMGGDEKQQEVAGGALDFTVMMAPVALLFGSSLIRAATAVPTEGALLVKGEAAAGELAAPTSGTMKFRSTYQGGPYEAGRFGRGGTLWNADAAYRSGQVRAERLIHEAGRQMGVDVHGLVDEIVYVPGAKAPFFVPESRILALNERAVFGSDESLRLLKAAHELGHAEVAGAPGLGAALSYEAEEVLVESRARAALGSSLSRRALRNSVQYENDYRALLGLPLLPVPP
jgi:hypothetical protein